MAANQFNIGKDVSLSIVGPAGALQSLGLLIEFNARQMVTTLQSLPINQGGIPVRRNTYQGWEGHFMFDRQGTPLDLLANLLEANFYSGNPDIHFQISETVRNPDGSTDHYTYLDCTLAMDDSGKYAQNAKVEQRVKFEAAQRVNG